MARILSLWDSFGVARLDASMAPPPRLWRPPEVDWPSHGTLSLLASVLAWLMESRSVVLGERGQRCFPLVATSSACPSHTTSTCTCSECFRLKVSAPAGAALQGERRVSCDAPWDRWDRRLQEETPGGARLQGPS